MTGQTSRAGPHHFSIVVTSPDHPGRAAQRGATLNINPYHEFSIGDLSPRRQTISYRQRTGRTVITIMNRGNSETTVLLSAEDDQRECGFEFEVYGEAVHMAGQAEVRIQPEETVAVLDGTPIALYWRAPQFSNLSINPPVATIRAAR